MDKIREIKLNRLPEGFLIKLIDGMTIREQTQHPDRKIWEKDSVVLFEQVEYSWCWVNYELIWCVFKYKFGYDFTEIQTIIKETLGEYTKIQEHSIRFQPYTIK